jgi:hypothetical protein
LGLTLAALAVLIAVVVGVTVAFSFHHTPDSPHTTAQKAPGTPQPANGALAALDKLTPLPAGYSQLSEAGAAAGFSIGVPSGWISARPNRLVWLLYSPVKTTFMRVELTGHTFSDMLQEARYLRTTDLSQKRLPGYEPIALGRATIRGTAGAVWEFSWLNDGIRIQAEDLLFDKDGQSYALYMVAQQSTWSTALPTFEQELSTFRVTTTS